MKNKRKKSSFIALTMIATLTQIGCGQICNDVMDFSEPTIHEIDVQNVSINTVSMSKQESKIRMALTQTPLPQDIIELPFINSFIGETQTVTLETDLVKVGNDSLQWDGEVTITITHIDGEEIDYSYTVDLQTSDTESDVAVLKIDGEVSYEKTQVCHDRGPS